LLNKILLIGNLGRDPEMSYTPSGSAVTKFSVAVSRRWTEKASGERKEETQWFNVVAWEKLAETCNQYLRKGAKVYLEGRMMSRKYTDKDHIERTVWEVVLNDMQMLEPKEAHGGASAEAGAGGGVDGVTPDAIPF
jgi:single-strand DNA-binding protein